MKLVRKNSEGVIKNPLWIAKKEKPCLDSSWHYHPEFELLYVTQSTGIRFVGDSVAQFQPGDLVLVGPYLPHLWRNDPTYYQQNEAAKVQTIVIKFTKDFVGRDFFRNPKFTALNSLLDRSKYGISFGLQIRKDLHQSLLELVHKSEAEQVIKLLEILHHLSLSEDFEVLSSTDMRQNAMADSGRLDAVLKYISDHYDNDIKLADVSQVACMTTNSFCRFFKKHTNKSFTQFLNEVRIRNASRLLVQEEASVSEISYTVGYKSITNFYRQFKLIMGSTPSEYRQAI